MRKFLGFLLVLVFQQTLVAQELRATVSVNSERMTDVNQQLFKNLETKIVEFLNNTKWTTEQYLPEEKIECNFFVNVSEFNQDSNIVTATLQVQSVRPIYNSTYTSPVLNLNDKDFSFRFFEYEQLVYDPNSFTSNLVSVLAYYANIVIGLDKETFKLESGTPYLVQASNIMNVAQTSGFGGWSQSEKNNNNRYFLITDLLSNTYKPYKQAMFEFHFNGLDLMHAETVTGKENIAKSIETLAQLQKIRPNALLTRVFFDAKTDEVVSIFSGGPFTDNSNLIQTLNRISPLNSVKWNNIR